MFDQLIREVAERFGLGDKAGSLVQSVVGMMTDERSGGLQGFLSAFDEGGMGSAARSWVGKGASESIDASQVESALGGGVIADLAHKFGLDRGIVGSALAFLIPRVVDLLTPDGNVPSSASLMGKLGGFLGGAGAAVAGAGAAAGRAAQGAVRDATHVAGAAAGRAGDAVRGVAGGAQRMAGHAIDEVGQAARKGGGMFKWLLPLLILALVLWWFARSCQQQSAGIGEDVGTTETMEGRDASGVGADMAHDVEAGVDAVAEGAKAAGGAVMGGLKDAAGAAASGAAAVGQEAVDTAASAGDAIADGARAAGDSTAAGVQAVGEAAMGAVDGVADAVAGEPQQPAADGARFDTASAVEQANVASSTALGALGASFTDRQLVDALNLSVINFASGSAVIPSESQSLLEEATRAMQRLPAGTRIEIGGHTDSTGSAAANDALSASRAEAVRNALVRYGASSEMLSTRGYGSAQPVASNDTEEGRFRNRRIGYTLVD